MTDPSGTTFFPPQASTVASEVDFLYYMIYYVSVVFFVAIIGAGIYFVWKYRKRPGGPAAVPISHNTALEVAWSVLPLFLLILFFAYGYKGYLALYVVPKDAMEIHVVGKKWLWAFEYGNGKKTTNELRVPAHKPVKLIMVAEDVLHSFFVPSFRIKQDLLPNRYTTVWFEATQTGEQQVYCTEYCGTGHSDMLAKIIVMEPADFKKWLEEGDKAPEGVPMVEVGKQQFAKNACAACHAVAPGGPATCPPLYNKWGMQEKLTTGQEVLVDENYVRESILYSNAKIVAGYQPVMPLFAGTLKDWQVTALIEYIKSLK